MKKQGNYSNDYLLPCNILLSTNTSGIHTYTTVYWSHLEFVLHKGLELFSLVSAKSRLLHHLLPHVNLAVSMNQRLLVATWDTTWYRLKQNHITRVL